MLKRNWGCLNKGFKVTEQMTRGIGGWEDLVVDLIFRLENEGEGFLRSQFVTSKENRREPRWKFFENIGVFIKYFIIGIKYIFLVNLWLLYMFVLAFRLQIKYDGNRSNHSGNDTE